METARLDPPPERPDSGAELVKAAPTSADAFPALVSLRYQYLFPAAVNDDGAGAGTLKWPAGERPFGSAPRDLAVNPALPSALAVESAFTAAECDAVIRLGESCAAVPGGTGDARSDYRVSAIHWIEPRDDAKWLYHRLAGLILQANRHYRFDLVGFVEALQFTTYGTNGRFEWHMDIGSELTSARKLSLTVQLSEEGDYDGGHLEFFKLPNMATSGLPRGSIIFFPSYLMHRVAEVTRGVRRSLVAWAYGPGFR